MEARITVLSDHRCHLGEGPSYDHDTDTAWWFDILESRMFEARVGEGTVREHALPRMASALARVDERRQLVAMEDGLYVRDVASGAHTLHTPLEAERPGMRSNDGRVHSSGAFWIGTMGKRAEEGAGSIYWFRDGELRRLFGGLTIPNAVSFSPDGATGYFVDTHEGILRRVPLDPATGLPAGEPQTLHDHRGGKGGMDGAAVDAQGRLWNARWGAGVLVCLSPEGDELFQVPVPASRPSCPHFVGADLDRILVTTAQEGMSEDERARETAAGRTLLLDGLGARGLPVPRVRLRTP